MSLLERILIAVAAVLVVAALVGLIKHDIGRTARSSSAAPDAIIQERPSAR